MEFNYFFTKENITFILATIGSIDGEMRRYHLDNNTLANKSLIASRTLYDKREHPEKFRLDELYRVMDVLGMKMIFVRREGPDE